MQLCGNMFNFSDIYVKQGRAVEVNGLSVQDLLQVLQAIINALQMIAEFRPAVNKHTKSNATPRKAHVLLKASKHHTPIRRSPERSKL